MWISSGCAQSCICTGGTVQCQDFKCPTGSRCQLSEDGSSDCVTSGKETMGEERGLCSWMGESEKGQEADESSGETHSPLLANICLMSDERARGSPDISWFSCPPCLRWPLLLSTNPLSFYHKALKCPAHSFYTNCLPSCLPSCSDPEGLCGGTSPKVPSTCKEGCLCRSGFVLHNNKCVLRIHCACKLSQGNLIQVSGQEERSVGMGVGWVSCPVDVRTRVESPPPVEAGQLFLL